MKRILFLTFILFSFGAFASSVDDNLSRMQTYLDNNQFEKVEDLYDEQVETLGNNWMALERLAISLERREKYLQAIEVYRKIIVNFNKIDHEKILATKPSRIVPQYYEGTKLPFYYYKLAYISTQLFLKTNDYTPEAERVKYRKNTEGFIGLARKVRVEESDLKILEEVINEKILFEKSLRYKDSWYASGDILSWQDRIILSRKASGIKSNLLSTAIGTCLGVGKKWENARYEFNFEGCYMAGTSTISSEDSTTYKQSSASVMGLIMGPGLYLKTISDNVLLGLHLPIKYRKGDWTNPDPSLYELQRVSALEVGFFLQSKIKVKKVSLRTRLGKVFPNPGVLWSVGGIYDF